MDIWDFRNGEQSGVDDETERLARAVIGAAIEVHRELGPGLPEASYQKSLCHELTLRGIPHRPEAPVAIHYKGVLIGEGRIDILVAGRLIIELKAVDALTEVHRSQVITYLRVTGLPLGLLINFNVAVLRDDIKRVVGTRP